MYYNLTNSIIIIFYYIIISIIIESLLNGAFQELTELILERKLIKIRWRSIKLNNYIRIGDSLKTTTMFL